MDDAQRFFNEGITLYGKGDYRRAITAFEKAISLDARLTEAWHNRGLALTQMGNYKGALQSFNRALALDPGHENARKAKRIVLGIISEQGDEEPPVNTSTHEIEAVPVRTRPWIVILAVAGILVVGIIGIMAVIHVPGPASLLPIAPPTTVPTTIPIPLPTTVPTTIPVPPPTLSRIPQTGVWVEISYDQLYSGTVGTPGGQQQLAGSLQVKPNTGDQFYQIPRTNNGYVTAMVNKNDGSGDNLTVNIYSDGTLIQSSSTTQPYGSLYVTATVPAATPTQSPDNSTVIAAASALVATGP